MLFLIPTPIGNLRDITLRALDILKEADLIVCEDTRRTQKLLAAYAIKNPTLSFHEHSGPARLKEITDRLREGKSLAFVTDGGMPLVSDPGFELVREAIREGIGVCALPGPTAFVTALAASGLASERFSFFGFLPPKSAPRKNFFQELRDRKETLIFYESPYRALRTLGEMQAIFGDREAVLARELTKKFEEIARGFLSELIQKFSGKRIL